MAMRAIGRSDRNGDANRQPMPSNTSALYVMSHVAASTMMRPLAIQIEMSKDFSIWIASGLIIVLAATWLITYNADVLLGIGWRLASPFRSLRPIARMAIAYPLTSRFRPSVTL